VLAGDGDRLRILDLGSGKISSVMVPGATGATLSPRGELAVTTDREISLWRTPFDQPFATLPGAASPRFTLDGRHIVVQRQDRVELLDAADGKAARPPLLVRTPGDPCTSYMLATNDLLRVVVAGCHRVDLWDVTRHARIASRSVDPPPKNSDTDTDGITAAALSPDGRRLALGTSDIPRALDGSVVVLETGHLKPVTSDAGLSLDVDKHDGIVEDLAFDVSGRALAVAASTPEGPGGRSARFEGLDLSLGTLDTLGPVWPGAPAAIVQAGPASGQFAGGNGKGLIASWDRADSSRLGEVLWRGRGALLASGATTDARTLAVTVGQGAANPEDESEQRTLIIDRGSGRTRVLTRSQAKGLIYSGGGPYEPALPMLFSPTGRLLLAQEGLWDVDSGRLSYPATASSGAFSPNGERLLLGRTNGTVVLLATTGSPQVLRVFRLPPERDPQAPTDVLATTFAADGTQVAAVSATGVVVRFDASSGAVLGSWTPRAVSPDEPLAPLRDAAFDGAGEHVALFRSQLGDVALDGLVDVADVPGRRLLGTLADAVSRGDFAGAGHLLMANDTEESLDLWGWNGEPTRPWLPLGIADVAGTVRLLDRDTAIVGVTRADGRAEVLRVWLAGRALMRIACDVAGRDFTASEKARYVSASGDTSACSFS
jgi:WD40 repeat protein